MRPIVPTPIEREPTAYCYCGECQQPVDTVQFAVKVTGPTHDTCCCCMPAAQALIAARRNP